MSPDEPAQAAPEDEVDGFLKGLMGDAPIPLGLHKASLKVGYSHEMEPPVPLFFTVMVGEIEIGTLTYDNLYAAVREYTLEGLKVMQARREGTLKRVLRQ